MCSAKVSDSEKRAIARRLRRNANAKTARQNPDTDNLTVLLELEIARRLPDVGKTPEERRNSKVSDVHKVPVASVISRQVSAAAAGTGDLSPLFDPAGYPFGGENREEAATDILNDTQTAAETVEGIIEEYRKYYGGTSENSNDDNDSSVSEASVD